MFQLLLIRHAQSANNALPESQRVPDPGLTLLGHRQATALANRLAEYRPTALLCSGFRRALETTQPIAQRLGLKPSVRYDLFEQGGCYAGHQPGQKKAAVGLGRSDIQKCFGDWSIDERITDLGWYHGRELESDQEAHARGRQVARWIVDELVAEPRDSSTLSRPALVIHADFKAILLEALLEMPADGYSTTSKLHLQTEAHNTSVTQLTWLSSGWRIDYWNSIDHLLTSSS